MAQDESTDLLREAVRLLRIMARPQIVELRERFDNAMLASPRRRLMWEQMDGGRSLSDISKKVGTSAEAVRLFVAEVEERWPEAIEVERTGAGTFPQRLI